MFSTIIALLCNFYKLLFSYFTFQGSANKAHFSLYPPFRSAHMPNVHDVSTHANVDFTGYGFYRSCNSTSSNNRRNIPVVLIPFLLQHIILSMYHSQILSPLHFRFCHFTTTIRKLTIVLLFEGFYDMVSIGIVRCRNAQLFTHTHKRTGKHINLRVASGIQILQRGISGRWRNSASPAG